MIVAGVNLHDWIDELCDALDVEVDLDEALILDLARDAAHNVARPAAPITTFLLGYAAAQLRGRPRRGRATGRSRAPRSPHAGTSPRTTCRHEDDDPEVEEELESADA